MNCFIMMTLLLLPGILFVADASQGAEAKFEKKTEENVVLHSLFEKYKSCSLITYQFIRKIISGDNSVFYKGEVSLVPFQEFKVNFFYPANESYVFDGENFVMSKDNKVIKKEKINPEQDLKSLRLITCFFLYYISKPDLYKFIKKNGDILVYQYERGENYKELLYINEKDCIPTRMQIDFFQSRTKIVFTNVRNIKGYLIPAKILTSAYSVKDFTKRVKEEVLFSKIKIEEVIKK